MVLVFNGEIYNYQEIREELLAAGHTFKTETDSEVLIHGYKEYGTELLIFLAELIFVIALGIFNYNRLRKRLPDVL